MPQTLADWFGAIEIAPLTEKQATFVDELLAMLETYAPPLLDRNQSSVEQAAKDTVELRLAHRDDPGILIEVLIDSIEITVSWISYHEHFGDWEATPDERPATSRAVDAIAGILRGDIEVEETYWRNRLIKSRMIDVTDPSAPAVVGETGRIYALLPLPGRKLVERRRIGFGSTRP